jgi:uncharacterized protein (DUF433 family)
VILVNYRRLGGSDAEILVAYPSLTRSGLEAAWTCADAHAEEIDCGIRENEEGAEG